MNDIVEHLHRQAAFSKATFGPGPRTQGVLKHIAQELKEVEESKNSNDRTEEWADIVILGLDGLLREIKYNSVCGDGLDFKTVAQIAWWTVVRKQSKNEMRDWPDWRGKPEDQPINHIRPVNAEKAQLDIIYDD